MAVKLGYVRKGELLRFTGIEQNAAQSRDQRVAALHPFSPYSMRQMMKRRLENAELPDPFSPHSLRVMVVTDILNQNVTARRRTSTSPVMPTPSTDAHLDRSPLTDTRGLRRRAHTQAPPPGGTYRTHRRTSYR